MLGFLEPRWHPKKCIIVDELDEFGEIEFVIKGSVVIGYEINRVKKYCIQYEDACVIGAYGITFNQRCAFIYAALTSTKGYAIRKSNWNKLIQENPDVAGVLKQNVLLEYLLKIRCKVLSRKKKAISEMSKRHDH